MNRNQAGNYSYRTEQAYSGWIIRFAEFHNLTYPLELHEDDVVAFLNWLAIKRNVVASTQNQALCTIIFLYDHILARPLNRPHNLQRAKETQQIPVVLSVQEARQIIEQLSGVRKIVVSFLYGSGLRLSECLRLRVQDIDFSYSQIWIRNSKGARITYQYCRKHCTTI